MKLGTTYFSENLSWLRGRIGAWKGEDDTYIDPRGDGLLNVVERVL